MNIKEEAILHSLRIISIDKSKKPESFGCGCLVLFRNFYFVLTVAHIQKTKESKLVLILHNLPELNQIPNWYIINPMKFKSYRTKYPVWFGKIIIKLFNKSGLSKKIDPLSKVMKYMGGVDFVSSAVYLPYDPVLSLPINSQYVGLPYKYFDYQNVKEPTIKENYSFYGLIELGTRKDNYRCKELYINNMKYIETKGYYHKFSIDQDNKILKGCSGSPILDSNGNLVSLVVKRDKIKKNIIYGIDLKKITIALHIEVNNITGEEIYE